MPYSFSSHSFPHQTEPPSPLIMPASEECDEIRFNTQRPIILPKSWNVAVCSVRIQLVQPEVNQEWTKSESKVNAKWTEIADTARIPQSTPNTSVWTHKEWESQTLKQTSERYLKSPHIPSQPKSREWSINRELMNCVLWTGFLFACRL